ncbi:hypothetical protein B7R74_01675 [Yersinia pseudotuberculosis]|nr:hypothetical protein B7R74_01675 [Yersinia pseudotuberculosis]
MLNTELLLFFGFLCQKNIDNMVKFSKDLPINLIKNPLCYIFTSVMLKE